MILYKRSKLLFLDEVSRKNKSLAIKWSLKDYCFFVFRLFGMVLEKLFIAEVQKVSLSLIVFIHTGNMKGEWLKALFLFRFLEIQNERSAQ